MGDHTVRTINHPNGQMNGSLIDGQRIVRKWIIECERGIVLLASENARWLVMIVL